jgi:hypothetical protein
MIKKNTLLKLFKPLNIYYSKMDNDLGVNGGSNFYCKICDVKCRDKFNFNRHLQSKAHLRIMTDNQNEDNNLDKKFICECGKKYNFSSGLCKHKKSCKFILDKKAEQDKTELLIQKIEHLEQIIQDQSFNQVINNTINNTNNNNFNINIFLNEKCKDAINMTEFIKLIKNSISDISSCIVNKNLNIELTEQVNKEYNLLDDYQKPYYITDKSRNSLYIKDNDEWVKDNGDLLYDKTKVLQPVLIKNKIDNFHKSVDMDNMTDNQQEDYCKLVSEATKDMDKTKIVKTICCNGVNPKEV